MRWLWSLAIVVACEAAPKAPGPPVSRTPPGPSAARPSGASASTTHKPSPAPAQAQKSNVGSPFQDESAHQPEPGEHRLARLAPAEASAAALAAVLRDNAHYVQVHGPEHFRPYLEKQAPFVTLVACSDSRYHADAIDRHPDNDVFEVRTIGNQLKTAPGSVEYAVRHLHTPLLVIMGHVLCGAVKAAMGDYSAEPDSVRSELDGLHLAMLRTPSQGSYAQRWQANVVANIHFQVESALRRFKAEVAAGKLTVLGMLFDFRNDLGQGFGKAILVNVNGEKDPGRMDALPLVIRARQLATAEQGPGH